MFKAEAGYAYKRYAYEKTKKKTKTKANKQNKKKKHVCFTLNNLLAVPLSSDKFDTIKSPTILKITNYSCIVPIVSANFPY